MGNCFGTSKKIKKGGYSETDIEIEKSRLPENVDLPDVHSRATLETI
jgi:hypothetical protein